MHNTIWITIEFSIDAMDRYGALLYSQQSDSIAPQQTEQQQQLIAEIEYSIELAGFDIPDNNMRMPLCSTHTYTNTIFNLHIGATILFAWLFMPMDICTKGNNK